MVFPIYHVQGMYLLVEDVWCRIRQLNNHIKTYILLSVKYFKIFLFIDKKSFFYNKNMQWLSWLLWLQKRNREFNGWFSESSIEYYIDGSQNEIEEIRKSLSDKNHDELELEVGDLLWDTLSLINKLDHEWLIDMDRVCTRAVAKFAERMPYNVEWYFEWDTQRRHDIWESVKNSKSSRSRWTKLSRAKVWEESDKTL